VSINGRFWVSTEEIRLEPVVPDIGRPYYRATTNLDVLALIEADPVSDHSETGSNPLRWWRRRESNPILVFSQLIDAVALLGISRYGTATSPRSAVPPGPPASSRFRPSHGDILEAAGTESRRMGDCTSTTERRATNESHKPSVMPRGPRRPRLAGRPG
jgi:hypothetical protein